jgi:hypothetical protein
MANAAFTFMHTTNRSHVHAEARAKILSLAQEIDSVYKQHLRKSTGRTCDICGRGDRSEKHRVKDVVQGYEHREEQSPCLCYSHACGWAHSFYSMKFGSKSDTHVDLHFAQYLANQLKKTATNAERLKARNQ